MNCFSTVSCYETYPPCFQIQSMYQENKNVSTQRSLFRVIFKHCDDEPTSSSVLESILQKAMQHEDNEMQMNDDQLAKNGDKDVKT